MLKRTMVIWGLVLSVGCVDKDGSDDADTADTASTGRPGGGGGGGGGECGVTVDETFPVNDASDAYYRGAVEFHLSDTDTTAVASIDGVTGDSSLNADGDVVTFTPDTPLSASTSYTASLDYCTGTTSINFTTSNVGDPVDAAGLSGNVYALALDSGRIVIPEVAGSILGEYLAYTIFISVDSADAQNIQMLGAVADEDDPSMQDYCLPTLPFPQADFTGNPYFQIGPETTTIDVAGYSITIDDLLISGAFAADASFVGGAQLGGFIDTRPLVGLIDEKGGDDAICSLVSGFGVSCIECSDGQPYCLELLAVDLTAESSNASVEEIELEDCHAQCPDSKDNPDCTL